jgi:hypothetical protein
MALAADSYSLRLKSGVQQMLDSCLEPGKIEALIMLDLQTKSTINQNNLQVQH